MYRLFPALCLAIVLPAPSAHAQEAARPNIVIIWGDDIGSQPQRLHKGHDGLQTPNIDRVANEGMMFTDYYAEQSCTAGRAAFISGQRCSARASARSACRAPTLGSGRKTRRSPGCSSPTATPRVSSARTTSATTTSTCRRCTASTSSTATCTTSTPRRSRNTATIPKDPDSARSTARAACWTAG